MQVLLALMVMAAAVAPATKVRMAALPGPGGTVAVSGVSGALNGAFAMGGPPAILMYFSSPAAVAIGRASLVAYFLGTDVGHGDRRVRPQRHGRLHDGLPITSRSSRTPGGGSGTGAGRRPVRT